MKHDRFIGMAFAGFVQTSESILRQTHQARVRRRACVQNPSDWPGVSVVEACSDGHFDPALFAGWIGEEKDAGPGRSPPLESNDATLANRLDQFWDIDRR
jgi:hypothetical protein